MKPPFDRLVDEHGAAVLRVCRAVLPEHDAEDAWSETFLAALRAYPDLPDTANVEAWLVTIAHRKAIDVVRARARRAVPVGDVPDAGTRGGEDPADAELWAAVANLPDKQRRAVAYRYAADLPYARIAEILGGTVDAARRAAADGVKNLRKTYSGASPGGERS
ncbi:RNA polymerase sigma factor [Tsukamurella sp. 1534]|uniref:RNA polymerase sigma factor n=1 Tax=Tsukamurella sp. 1534 TaxID=1151061 RepID=UPI0003008AD2|nr:sigma-70 family RNA polymerase sigma factor [Tsukamurella sp. 1534]